MVYLMVCISMIMLRKKKTGEKDYFKVRYGYFLAAAGIGFAVWLLLSSKGKELREIGVAVLIGIVFYGIFELWKNKSAKNV